MKITVVALGSRGDVQPFVALALALRERGHTARIAAAADYAPLVETYGIAFAPLVGHIRDLINPDAMGAMHGAGGAALALRFFRDVPPLIARLVADVQRAARDADLLLVSALGQWPGMHVAEQHSIPLAVAQFHPAQPTAEHPQMFFPAAPPWLPGAGHYHRTTYRLYNEAHWLLLAPALNRARQQVLGLPSQRNALARSWRWNPPTIYGYSVIVAAPPPDALPAPITGYWTLPDEPWQPPDMLAAFLAAGPPPLAVSFGSMMFGQREGARLTSLLAAAAERAGVRLVLGRGWGDLGAGQLPPHVLAIDSAPHQALFRHVRGVLHHGGAGVAAAALGAGIPALTVPFLGDQSFWGDRVAALGAGLPPLPFRDLSLAPLAAAMARLCDDTALHRRARAVAALLALEHGADRAADLLTSAKFATVCDGSHG